MIHEKGSDSDDDLEPVTETLTAISWNRTVNYIAEENLPELSQDLCDRRVQQRVISWRSENRESIVLLMVLKGKVDLLKLVLSHLPLDEKEYLLNQVAEIHRGTLPIHAAVRNADMKCVQLLLDHGTDLNVTDNYGFTALHRASSDGHVNICKLLLLSGANVFSRDKSGYTPWLRACSKGRVEVCVLLLEYLKEQNMMNHLLDEDRVAESSLNVIAMLVRNRTDELVSLVVEEAGLDINALSPTKNITPLHSATIVGNVAAVKSLLAHGASPNVVNSGKSTVLHLAVDYGQMEICKLLLEFKNTDISLEDDEGRTARELAMEMQQFAIVTMFDSDPYIDRRLETIQKTSRIRNISLSSSIKQKISALTPI